MTKPKQKVICVGSLGKDIFFPVSSGVVLNDKSDNTQTKKQFCFGYGGKVHVEDRFTAPGGCACNVSIGLARLGVDVAAFGNIGDDFDGDWIVVALQNENVDTTGIVKIQKSNTDLSVVIVDSNAGERTIFVNRDVGEKLQIASLDIESFNWCFIGSLYGDDIVNNMSVIHEQLSKKQLKLAYNPGGKNINQDEKVVLDLIHHAHIVFVNKSEAQEIVSKFNLSYNEEDLANEEYLLSVIKQHMLNSQGIVVITDGLRGAWSYDGEDIYHTNTLDKEVHDSTGAGDAFASGFFASILYGNTIEVSMLWASVNGNCVIDYYGAQKGLQSIDDIKQKINLFKVENKKQKNENIQ